MIVNENFLRAISWTLAHSIWQGLLLAFLSGIVIMATRKSAALIRYNVIAALFVSFLFITALTFNYQMHTQQLEYNVQVAQPTSQIDVSSNTNFDFISTDIVQRLVDLFNTNADIIALIWFMIFCIRFFKIFSEFNEIYKIRTSKVHSASDFWQSKIRVMSDRIHLKQAVLLLESKVVKVPSVTGFFKPILLLPVGLLANLPHDQIEAILLHELAHIRRKDYLVNIIQCFVEVLFFFNPGLLWVSSILRDERENCCDDIAISATNNKQGFVRALLSFEEYKFAGQTFAIGFGGSKNHLLHRVKRIFGSDNKTLNSVEKTSISVSLLLIFGVFLACSNSAITNSKSASSIKSKTISTTTTSNSVSTYQTDFTDIKLADEKAAIADAQAIISDKKAAFADAEAAKIDADVARVDAKVAENDVIVAKEDLKFAKSEYEITLAKRRIAVTEQQMMIAEKRLIAAEVKSRNEHNILDIKSHRSNSLTNSATNKNSLNQNSLTSEAGTPNDSTKESEADQLTKGIIADLLSDRLISSTSNLSFSLNKNKLVVNGVAQPKPTTSKFITKYVKNANVTISYNHQSTDKM